MPSPAPGKESCGIFTGWGTEGLGCSSEENYWDLGGQQAENKKAVHPVSRDGQQYLGVLTGL